MWFLFAIIELNKNRLQQQKKSYDTLFFMLRQNNNHYRLLYP